MGAKADLMNPTEMFDDGMDSVVIRQYGAGIKGGRTLDTSNFPLSAVRAGHIVIRDTVNDIYKPMPLNSGNTAYGSLPASHEYVGFVVNSVPASRAMVGIMYAGEINDKAMPYPVTGDMLTAVKTALPMIAFMHD